MAITSNNQPTIQVAVCKSSKDFTVKGEIKKVFKFELEGKEFEIWESSYFAPEVGSRYRPVVQIKPVGYIGKDGKARANEKPFVSWEKI